MQSENREARPSLSERQAFLVMMEFTWRFAKSAGDDLLTLLGDTEIRPDGSTVDPAAWDDWQECVDWILAGHSPRNGGDW